MDQEQIAAWCTTCGYKVTQAKLDQGLSCCPSCGSTGIPCSSKFDTTVNINWHELRILTIWAENWARQVSEEQDYSNIKVVHAIARRLQEQKPAFAPLTLAGEVRELQQFLQEHGGSIKSINFDAREHLVNPPKSENL